MRRCGNNFASRVRVARWAVTVMLALSGVPVAHAEIVPDTTFRSRPTISHARNGVPVIAINTPSSSGVSFNAYKAFGVDEGGVVLNNSSRPVGTELAYNVSRNPNLVGRLAARIIVSEVTGREPSILKGNIEVAGERADVVIANPNGITCSGCGFLWTDRVVLTTGRPAFTGAIGLEAFIVTQGEINVEDLVAPGLAHLDLIGRKVIIKGEVRAMDVGVISGANQVRYLTKQARTDGGEDVETTFRGVGTHHAHGIDVAALGGIYANKIRLLSTENGVGVRVDGKLASSAGDLEINSAGGLNVGGTLSSSGGALIIRAGSSSVVGALAAPPDVSGSGGAAGSQVTGNGAGGLHVIGEGVGTGGSQAAGWGTGAGGAPVASGGAGVGVSPVTGGVAGAGVLSVTGGVAGAGGSQVASGGAGVDVLPVTGGVAGAGGSQVASGGAGVGMLPVTGGVAGAGGSQVASGGAGVGVLPVTGGVAGAGGSPTAGGGAATGGLPVAGTARPPVASGGVQAGISPHGADEAPQRGGEAEAEIIKVPPAGATLAGSRQVDPLIALIGSFSPTRWLPFNSSGLAQYLMQVQEIIAKAAAAQSKPASVFTLPKAAPGTTTARVDASFEEQRMAAEGLLPEKRRRSYDVRDFEQGHRVFSTSAANSAKRSASAVAMGWPS